MVDLGDPLQTTAVQGGHSRKAVLEALLQRMGSEGHKQEMSILTASADLQQIAALEVLNIAAALEGLRLAVALEDHPREVVLVGLHLMLALVEPQLPIVLEGILEDLLQAMHLVHLLQSLPSEDRNQAEAMANLAAVLGSLKAMAAVSAPRP